MISTGRVLPDSVPRCGLRLASQTSPRLIIWIPLDPGEFRVNTHTFLADAARGICDAKVQSASLGLVIHSFDSAADVLRSRNTESSCPAVAFLQQVFGQFQGNCFHGSPLQLSPV